MVAKCCIKGCKSEKYPGCEMTFHGFPSDQRLQKKWIQATQATGNVKYKRICPLHFNNEDFVTKGKVIHLKQNVIPSFCIPFKCCLKPTYKQKKDGQARQTRNMHHLVTFAYRLRKVQRSFVGLGVRFYNKIPKSILDLPLNMFKKQVKTRLPFRTYTEEDKMIFGSSGSNHLTNQDYENEEGIMHVDDNSLQGSNDNLSFNILSRDAQKMKALNDIPRCSCCMDSDRLSSMWQEHCSGGQREVYGTMLMECFALHWKRPKNPSNSSDLICESCIMRLRDAVSFKTEILASQRLLRGQIVGVDIDKLKQEQEDASVPPEYLHYENVDHTEVNSCDDDGTYVGNTNDGEKDSDSDKELVIKSEPFTPPNNTRAASDRKEAVRKRRKHVTLRNSKMKINEMGSETMEASTRSKMSKTINSDILKYDEDLRLSPKLDFNGLTENFKKGVEAVHAKEMYNATAAMAFTAKELNKVPRAGDKKDSKETKARKQNGVVFVEVQKINENDIEDSKKTIAEIKDELMSKKTGSRVKEKNNGTAKKTCESRLSEMKKQANNIAVILESTNATPIRRHGGIGYGCCFCNDEFPEAADLKQHTIKEHDVKTKRNYAKGKRPSAYLVKLDITGLKCNLCGNTIDTLEQLYDHLTEVHKKLLYRNAKNYIIPFKFDQDELKCLFCEFICNSFKGLLEHMSVHYRNHICQICDAGFLTTNNLFNHAGRHKKGTFKCDYCPKVFDTSSKKGGHQRLVHSSTNGVNRCGYCGEMFGTYRRKEKHLITVHGITLKKLKCKACDKTFETQTALRIHTKRDHLIERRFKCSVCDKRCFTNVQLSQHTLKHTGIKKFQCTICMKAYGRKSTLREHMRIHENDRRFKCDLCGMAFVQKCSWRGHMLSKHGQQV